MFILTGSCDFDDYSDPKPTWNVAVSNDRLKLEALKENLESTEKIEKATKTEYYQLLEKFHDQFRVEGKFPPRPAHVDIPKLPNRMDRITPEMRAERANLRKENDRRDEEWSVKNNEINNQINALIFAALVEKFGDVISSECSDIHSFLNTFVYLKNENAYYIEEIDEL